MLIYKKRKDYSIVLCSWHNSIRVYFKSNLHVLAPLGAKLTRAATASAFWSLAFFLIAASCANDSPWPAPPAKDARTDFTACKSPKPHAS